MERECYFENLERFSFHCLKNIAVKNPFIVGTHYFPLHVIKNHHCIIILSSCISAKQKDRYLEPLALKMNVCTPEARAFHGLAHIMFSFRKCKNLQPSNLSIGTYIYNSHVTAAAVCCGVGTLYIPTPALAIGNNNNVLWCITKACDTRLQTAV